MNNKDKKNILIIALLIAVVFMSTGYALLSEQLSSDKEVKNGSVWDINLTNIKGIETTGLGVSLTSDITSSLSATFSTRFEEIGDSVTYSVMITNNGSMDAKVDNIVLSSMDKNNVNYVVDGIDIDKKIEVGENLTFTVKIESKVDIKFIENSVLILDLSHAN